MRQMTRGLVSIASITGIDISFDKLSKTRPIEISIDEFKCFGEAEVTCHRRVMVFLQNSKTNRQIIRYID